jgi:hypothetical protein
MTKLIFDISMSLAGFVTASNVRPEEPMGDGGQRLHEWALASTSAQVRDLSKARMEQCLDKMAAIFAWA